MSAKHKTVSEHDRLARENARLRGDLLTIANRVSHDLRTPLGSIVNLGELMREIMSEKDPASAALIDPLFNSVDELQGIIKRVSFIARASASPIPKGRLKMGEIISGTLQELESRILKKNASVKSPDDWPEVEAVPSWLAFIWWHLIINALQHGGRQIQLGWRSEKEEICFWISDSGPGVPIEVRKKLFQPFDSLHQPDSTRGLGLSAVQRLVELQGGHCGYEPNAGKACFFFTLPAAKAKP